uniref:Sideroflexin 4 n=1 Tax=Stegastes partitus TaxID=144197 RepID=A0A3B4YUL8_9TELE
MLPQNLYSTQYVIRFVQSQFKVQMLMPLFLSFYFQHFCPYQDRWYVLSFTYTSLFSFFLVVVEGNFFFFSPPGFCQPFATYYRQICTVLAVFAAELQRRVQPRKQKRFHRAGQENIFEAASADRWNCLLHIMRRGVYDLIVLMFTVMLQVNCFIINLPYFLFQALPQILINRLSIRSPDVLMFCRSIIPIPLTAALAFFNVFTVRNEESETGIQVFDRDGNPVGISKAAAEKAVRETALSRAVLFGCTAVFPNLLVLLLKRTRFFQKNSLLAAPFRHISAVLTMGLMVPVSFSLFSQLGTIKREALEEELQAGAAGGQLFYHRGL